MRTNAGYTIKDAVHVGDVEYVLGEHGTARDQYVTWECTGGDNYYAGHYFDNRPAALKDLLDRTRYALSEDADEPFNKPYFFCMTICSMRTGIAIGRRCGVVWADSQESAELTAWEQYGGDNACKLWAQEVPDDGFSYNVFKSEIL